MHIIKAVKTSIVICFLIATIVGLVSAKPSPRGVLSKPLSGCTSCCELDTTTTVCGLRIASA
jgi:hypothetical protein